jgi:hypothetical protein
MQVSVTAYKIKSPVDPTAVLADILVDATESPDLDQFTISKEASDLLDKVPWLPSNHDKAFIDPRK